MSRLFLIEQSRKRRGCPVCKKARFRYRKETYSLCEEHLNRARIMWHRRVAIRARNNQCINCSNKKLKNEQRCSVCKIHNKTKCLKWMKNNRAHVNAYHKRTFDAHIKNNECPSCWQHRPLKEGRRRCDVCNAKARIYR